MKGFMAFALILSGVSTYAASSEPACILDAASVAEFKKQKEDLAGKQKEIQDREGELKAKEDALQAEMKKLQDLKGEIAGIRADQEKQREAQVQKVVEAIESMSPKASALMLAKMDDGLVAKATEKLTSLKLAKVLAAMEPARSAQIATILAAGKKGANDDGKSNRSISSK